MHATSCLPACVYRTGGCSVWWWVESLLHIDVSTIMQMFITVVGRGNIYNKTVDMLVKIQLMWYYSFG